MGSMRVGLGLSACGDFRLNSAQTGGNGGWWRECALFICVSHGLEMVS